MCLADGGKPQMIDFMSVDLLLLLVAAPFIGSFLSVLVLRLPAGEDVVFTRSHCRSCQHPLGVRDLIPIASWLISRGRCRHCGTQVDALYPLMELASVLVVVWAALVVDAEALMVTVVFGWVLLALAVMDLHSLFLADALTLPLIPTGLAFCLWLEPEAIWAHVAGAVAGAAVLAALSWGYFRLRGREGLGLGDVKLMAAAGAWVGVGGLGTVILWAVMVNAIMIALDHLRGRPLSATTQVPLGTGLATGLWLTWLYGPVSIA
jgi:leader peptidase (prepilin peptidase) / N-methyltransferase